LAKATQIQIRIFRCGFAVALRIEAGLRNVEYSVKRIRRCRIMPAMLTDYIREAMRLAHYDLMENGRFFATITGLKGVWAEEATLEACREELQSTLEDWIMIKARFGDKDFPVLGGIDLNPKPEYAQAD
jgi:predicted RNase H-like HicB family nuclease